MKKIVCLFLMAGLILAINSCNESELEQEELLKSSAGYDELIEKAETWYIDAPDENSFPVLAFADELIWNQAMVHDVDTAFMIEVPIKLKNRYGLADKNDKTQNVEQRMLFWYDGCDFKSYLELIVSTDKKENLQNIKKINFGNKENGFTGSFIISDISRKNINVWNYTVQEDQAVEMITKSMQMICIWLVWYDEFGNITEYIDLLYCYPIGGGSSSDTGGGGGGSSGSSQNLGEICNCEICSNCGYCIKDSFLKSIPKPDEGESGEETVYCPECICPKVIEDPSFEDTKADCVYDKLVTSNQMQQLLSEYFGSDTYHVTYKVDYWSTPGVNSTDPSYGLAKDNGDNTVTIKINSYYFDEVAPVTTAKTILHETIHAYLYQEVNKLGGLDNLENTTFENLFAYYQTYGYPDYQHDYMSQYYIPNMAQTLRQYDNYAHGIDYYEALAWQGLSYTYGWQQKTQAEKDAINAKVNEINSGNKECN
ncbi:hypothetical protein [Draconibacterium mangrovi]|uniref:hypothetical protein n=1 Tax=Draconibacterium mangrovi TaxID=2697469 RepID=UPI0013D07441|nr:hypothetical protein [Draconibacterium mangrovi]